MAIGVMTWVWNHSRSRHGARLVLLAIADCASGDGGNAWPSNAELQRKAGIGERAVQSAIAELVKLGELEVRYNEGPGGCNRYRVIMGDPRNIRTPAESAPPQILRGSRKRAAKSPQDKPQTPAESAPPQILRGSRKRAAKSPQDKPQTPAESAPPQISQQPPQNLHPTPAESAPVTVLEPTTNQHQKTSSSGAARATRIPDDFAVTPEMVTWARTNVPHVDGRRETERFIDHWHQASGRTASKRDWIAAWRNWMREADDRLGRNGAPGRGAVPAVRPSTTDQRVAQGEALKAELAEARNGKAS